MDHYKICISNHSGDGDLLSQNMVRSVHEVRGNYSYSCLDSLENWNLKETFNFLLTNGILNQKSGKNEAIRSRLDRYTLSEWFTRDTLVLAEFHHEVSLVAQSYVNKQIYQKTKYCYGRSLHRKIFLRDKMTSPKRLTFTYQKLQSVNLLPKRLNPLRVSHGFIIWT